MQSHAERSYLSERRRLSAAFGSLGFSSVINGPTNFFSTANRISSAVLLARAFAIELRRWNSTVFSEMESR